MLGVDADAEAEVNRAKADLEREKADKGYLKNIGEEEKRRRKSFRVDLMTQQLRDQVDTDLEILLQAFSRLRVSI